MMEFPDLKSLAVIKKSHSIVCRHCEEFAEGERRRLTERRSGALSSGAARSARRSNLTLFVTPAQAGV
jgi:hypothetical protein